MAFTVSEFKSNLKQGGARPSLFSVSLSYPVSVDSPAAKSEFLIKNATIPTSTIGTYDVHFHGKAIKVAGDRTFDTWDTTIINDEDFGIRNALEQWMNSIASQELNIRSDRLRTVNVSTGAGGMLAGGFGKTIEEGTQARYKKNIVVTQFSKSGKAVRKYTFNGAFPTSLSSINLDWSASDIEEYTCTWAYDYWTAAEHNN
jgi:hypothetical protein